MADAAAPLQILSNTDGAMPADGSTPMVWLVVEVCDGAPEAMPVGAAYGHGIVSGRGRRRHVWHG